MENSPEQMPSIIFEWLEKYDFSQINSSQQEEVLHYFSIEDYNALHNAAKDLKAIGHKNKNHKQSIKESLLKRFAKVHGKRRPVLRILLQPVSLWKVASLLIIISSILVFYSKFSNQNNEITFSKPTTDTVYIVKESPSAPVLITDTIYLPNKRSETRGQTTNNVVRIKREQEFAPGDERINIVSIKSLEQQPNVQKRNSMKDDSLLSKYSFISL